MAIVEANCFGPFDINPPFRLPIREYILDKDCSVNRRRYQLVSNTLGFCGLDIEGVFEHLIIPDELD